MSVASSRSAVLIAAATLALVACANAGGARQEGGGPSRVAITPISPATDAEKKVTSQLLREIYRAEGRAVDRRGSTIVRLDADDRALVDIRTDVTPAMLARLEALKATTVSTSARDRSIVAWVPLLQLLTLAEDPEITSIVPAQLAATSQTPSNPTPAPRP